MPRERGCLSLMRERAKSLPGLCIYICNTALACVSHITAVLSKDDVANHWPFGEYLASNTPFVCASICLIWVISIEMFLQIIPVVVVLDHKTGKSECSFMGCWDVGPCTVYKLRDNWIFIPRQMC